MAVLAVAGLGAWGSAALGFGWQAGWLLGSTVGSLLFNKVPDQEGPRLTDLTVTSSAYGAPVPIGYGTLRMSGNIIWSSGLREEKIIERQGGKGGGAKSTTYTYFASFAIAFAEGEADDVLRLWADGKLIYDKRGTGTSVAKSSFKMRFYPGSETQLPDPLIESVEGAGNVPAHRGLCYIVFEDLALEDFGNRIPNITAEITFSSIVQKPAQAQALDFITTGEGGVISSYQGGEFGVDWMRGVGYLLNTDSDASLAGIRRFNLRTMVEDRQARMTDVAASPNNFPATLFVGADSHLYMTVGSSNCRPIIRVEPDSLREVARFGFLTSGLSNTSERFVAVVKMTTITTFSASGREDFLLTGSLFDDVGVLRADGLSYVWGGGQAVDEARVGGMVGGIAGNGFGEGWILGTAAFSSLNHNSVALYRVRISPGLFGVGVNLDKVKAFTAAEIESSATGFYGDAKALTYDPTDDSVIFQVRMSNGGTAGNIYTLKWRAGTGIVWKTQVPVMLNRDDTSFNANRLRSRRWTVVNGFRIIQLDTSTGAIVYDEVWPYFISNNFQHYDAVTDSLIASTSTASVGVVRIFLGRGGGEGATVGTIVGDLCERAGLGLSDTDVAELTDVVPGYVIARPSTVRASIEPLARAFFFDGVESDDLLKFRLRGRAPALTLNADLLIPLSGESAEAWRESRTQEVELPERVNVIHMDPDLDYQQGAQMQKRAAKPVPTMLSRNQQSLELPMAITSDTAKSIAAKALYSAWIERSRHEARLPSDYLRLDPTDVVDVTLPSGASLRTRIERIDIGADFSISLRAVSQEAASYTASLTADGGSGRPPQVLAGDPQTRLFVADLPLLRDVDDTAAIGSRIYLMGGGFGASNWPGASVFRSPDNVLWSVASRIGSEIAYGATINALAAPVSPFSTDDVNELHVFMTTGADRLESVTQEAMLNGANVALLLKANGEPEVIQFREVTPSATGGFALRGLLRGRRGTDIFTAGHSVGETFVLLEPAAMEAIIVALGDLGVTRYWRAVGTGQLFDDAETISRTNTGRDLKPYAVAQPRGVVASGNINLSWVRRTRLGGDLRDGTGTVPLAEASEAYEVDILDGPGGAVLRTLSATSPAATYLGADITTDFGTMPAQLSVVIYQMSAVIGRGLPRTVTLEIA
jgi:hypothetical protein